MQDTPKLRCPFDGSTDIRDAGTAAGGLKLVKCGKCERTMQTETATPGAWAHEQIKEGTFGGER